MTARRKTIQAVHVEARRRGIDHDTRRGIQRAVVGVESCADMSVQQLRQVLDALKGRRGHLSAASDAGDSSRERMVRKVRAMQAECGLTAAYIDGISRRMYRRRLDACDPTQLRGVIAALVRYRNRRAAR